MLGVATHEIALALDIGGTKIAGALVGADGAITARVERPTPPGDAATVWAAVASCLGELTASGPQLVGVGIATAGPIDVARATVSPVNIAGWRGFPLVDQVERVVPGVPVRLIGDAIAMAVAEHRHGAGRGADQMVGMVVSTGVGGGLVIDGRVHAGPSGNAGHVGHVSMDLDGEPCACGGVGCLETIASGPALTRWAVAHGYDGLPDAASVAAAARAGDEIARGAYVRAGLAIGSMLAGVASVCDVRLAVIGGGVAKAGDLLFEPIRAGVDRYGALSYVAGFEVRPAALGPDAGLLGAAAHCFEP